MFRKPGRTGMVRMGGLATLLAMIVLAVVVAAGQDPARPAPVGPRQLAPAGAVTGKAGRQPGNAPAPVALSNGMKVISSSKPILSPPVRSLEPVPPLGQRQVKLRDEEEERIPVNRHQDRPDTVVQRSVSPSGARAPKPAMPATSRNFAGISFTTGGSGIPPDTNGEVGPSHFVQMVNSSFMVWNKAGAPLLSGPVNINALWTGAGTQCEASNDGDPVVLYDQLADRWLISQFAFAADAAGNPVGPYYECVAVSQTGNPTGSYFAYTFQLSATSFADYPHLGVWPDGYYMTTNQFDNATTYAGPAATVFERSRMLAGGAARVLWTGPLGSTRNPMLPSDLDGATRPPVGAPNYFVEGADSLTIYKFHVDWTTLANSTFTRSANLPVAPFTQLCPLTANCIPQRGTTQRLDGLADRLMFRLAYRRFSDHESLVVNHTVNAGSGRAGIRWYEVRSPGGAASIFQQGTYAPADTNHRWLGSVAMDRGGNLAAGYSVSGGSTFPSIRYTGRLATDPRGTLPQGEGSLLVGTGFQSGFSRWGDYSDLTLDPTDDCTFWYTTEFNSQNDSFSWETRIGSFRFVQCDSTLPTVRAPSQSFSAPSKAPSTATTSALPVRIGWSATDRSGIAGYQLMQKTDAGRFVSVPLSPATATSVVRNLTPGHTYQFQVRAQDRAGNLSAWKPGVSFKLVPYQETRTTADSTGSKITYSTGWTQQSLSGSYGGGVRFATVGGKTATFTFSGRGVAWVSPKSSARGQARIFVDGGTTPVATIDLKSTTELSRQVVYARSWSALGSHTLKVQVVGTSGRPRVDVDAFLVVR